ncbi:MAG: Rieske (2Fe-2S) protein [Actinobacteria bacterium]|nr:Rieske (2Fe-2S) protein [Actinomycetota bacterium]
MNPISRRILGFGFISSLATIAFPALAATTPPMKCRVLGQTTTYNGRLFTCIKVKSKGKNVLAWDSGKIIPSPSPTSSESATPSPTPSASKSPEPVVVKKADIAIAKSSEIPLHSTKSFTAKNRYGNTTTYILARNSGGILAMDATCPHKGCIVAVESEGLLCPCHNALFDPKNGDVLRGPASYALERVPVREENGIIYLTD